jgi:Uma2 family endonuclease
MNTLPIEDMSNTFLEHSIVIHNFVIKIGSQVKDSLCRVFGDSVQYQWRENEDKVVVPDVSIICNMRDRKNVSFTGIPRFVMEVVSDATEEYDRNEKMQIYCKVGISEYWIVDWRKKQVEIYLFDGKEDGSLYPYLFKTVTENNKEELQLVMFPNFKITFDELFDIE